MALLLAFFDILITILLNSFERILAFILITECIIIFCLDTLDLLEILENDDADAGRFVRYFFTPLFLKLNTIAAT